MSRLRNFFDLVFHIRPHEHKLVQPFFFYFLIFGAVYAISNTVGDALFLARLGPQRAQELLPWAFLGIVAASLLTSYFYDFIQGKLERVRLVVGAHLSLAVMTLLLRQALQTQTPAIYFGLMVALDTFSAFNLALIYSYAGDYFTSHEARRLYNYITGGIGLGALTGGFAVDPLVDLYGAENLLYVCAALQVLASLSAFLIARGSRPVSPYESSEQAAPQAPLRAVISNRYLKLAFVMIAISCLCMAITEYELKVEAVGGMDETELAVFFGKFYGLAGIAGVLIEFFIVGWSLLRMGTIKTLMVLPILLIASHAVYFFHPSLMNAAFAYFVVVVLMDTLDLSARELLFIPLPPRIRWRSQALADSAIEPLGGGLAGAALLIFSGLAAPAHFLAAFVIFLGGCWLAAVFFLRPAHRETLASSLRKRHFDPEDLHRLLNRKDSAGIVHGLLGSENADEAAFALDLLKGRPLGPLAGQVRELAKSNNASVAVPALRLLGSGKNRENLGAIRLAMKSSPGEVKSAAALALCEILQEDAVREIKAWLESPDPFLREAALLGFANYGGFDGALLVYPQLDRMLKSKTSKDRIEAARLIARIGGRGAARVLERLISDPDHSVRREALMAAGELKDPNFVSCILDSLGEISLRPLAAQALNRMPQTAVSRIAEALRLVPFGQPDPAYLLRVLLPERMLLARALGHIGGAEAIEALWELLDRKEELILRLTAASALRQIKKRGLLDGFEFKGLDKLREGICEEMDLMKLARRAFGKEEEIAAILAGDTLRVQGELLLMLLALEFHLRQIGKIEAGLFGANEALRGNALELLEISLPSEVAGRVMPLFGAEPPGFEGGLTSGAGLRLLQGNLWFRALVLFHQFRGGVLPDTIKGVPVSSQDQSLYKVVSHVAFLKRTSLFSGVPSNYLTSLAEIVQEKTLYVGERLFSEGDFGDALYLICEGRVGIIKGESEVAQIGAGECVGETSVIDGMPRSATAVVIENARFLKIASEDFWDLVSTQPAITKALLQTLSRRLRASKPT